MNILEVAVKNNERCAEWTEKMPSQTLQELIPGVQETDIADDTGKNTIELDPGNNPCATQARMFTL